MLIIPVLSSPDITERIDSFLDIASSLPEGDVKGKGRVLDINQVLVNEYQAGQGISVCPHVGSSNPFLTLLSHTKTVLHSAQ